MSEEKIRKQAVRLLNPFRGVMNIIEYKGAEAVTIDGVNWDIYVKDLSLMADLDNRQDMLISEIRFGHWSRKKGLTRGSIYPSEDFNEMERQGQAVFDYLLQHAHEVPFRLTDIYELWLLDEADQPVALINSQHAANRLYNDIPLSWTAGNACRQYFMKNSKPGELSLTRLLETNIRKMTGDNPRAQWFRRNETTSTGLSGINLNHALEQREISNQRFPQFFITLKLSSYTDDLSFDDYLEFLAPYLLTLPSLSNAQREKHEKSATRQALCVAKLYRLYPAIINQKYLNSALVEARLRNSVPVEEQQEKVLSPEYIELNISRTN